ncbi:hypothetical protein ACFL27_21395 [candidate division CSSED10-310 bacterium]|uniref:Polymerase nucleotidyl transferase domain-containing protein n=1 Tax=candidate division CSSED10-310 bacterium TaxID=2855610 RepID=A0ABV6Z2T1_UNCC1
MVNKTKADSLQSIKVNHDRLMMIIEPIIYGDIFDYPVSLSEIHKFCPVSISRAELEQIVNHDTNFRKLVSCEDGYYYLTGREVLVKTRQRRKKIAEKLWRRASLIARIIQYIPFIKSILVTGSLAINNVEEKDDLDFLIITSSKRIWFVFAILGTLQRLISRRNLCPNYYLSLDNLGLQRKTRYIAREAIQARSMYGAEGFNNFREQNDWVYDFYPNSRNGRGLAPEEGKLSPNALLSFLSIGLERVMSGTFGDYLEKLCQKMLKHRLYIHYRLNGQDVPPEVLTNALHEIELRFHGLNHEGGIFREFDERKQHLQTLLENEGVSR